LCRRRFPRDPVSVAEWGRCGVAFEAGDDVVWLKASTRGQEYGRLVPATVLRDDGRGQVQVEARMPNGGLVRRWVAARRLRRANAFGTP